MHSRPSVCENCLQISYMESKTTEYLGRMEINRMSGKNPLPAAGNSPILILFWNVIGHDTIVQDTLQNGRRQLI